MRKILALALTSLTLAVLASPAHLPLPQNPEPDAISAFHDCIQHRFLETKSFGMRRVLPQRHAGIFQFRPENSAEQAVVDRIEQQGYELAFFLAGRQILAPPAQDLSALIHNARLGVQGPAFITALGNSGQLPDRQSLLEDARTALASFDHNDRYQTEKDGWTILMRPLRATGESCVQCHSAGAASWPFNSRAKLGDALGAAIYAYRHVPEDETR